MRAKLSKIINHFILVPKGPAYLCQGDTGVPVPGSLCRAVGVYLVPARRALGPSMLPFPCAILVPILVPDGGTEAGRKCPNSFAILVPEGHQNASPQTLCPCFGRMPTETPCPRTGFGTRKGFTNTTIYILCIYPPTPRCGGSPGCEEEAPSCIPVSILYVL